MAVIALTLFSCKSSQSINKGFGGTFGTAPPENVAAINNNVTDDILKPSVQRAEDAPNQADLLRDTRVRKTRSGFARLNHSVLKKTSIRAEKKFQRNLEKKAPDDTTGNDGGGAILVLLLFAGLIIYGLVKLAGVSLGQILLILGIVLFIVLVFIILFVLLNKYGS